MDLINISFIAIGLAMDAFTLSICAGITIEKPNAGHFFRISFAYGFFQFLMPIIGYFGGKFIAIYLNKFSFIIAFLLLIYIGIKMIYESIKNTESCEIIDPSRGKYLIMSAIATSIDALAVGISLGILKHPILLPSIIIGIICSIFALIGIQIGNKIGHLFDKYAEIFGGSVLIIIAIKILLENIS